MKLLILDLDETLIYATEEPLERRADFQTELYHVYKRPYVDEFLAFCRENFLVAVWTTAGAEFAQDVVEGVFPSDYPLQFLWSRERCSRTLNADTGERYLVKNLAKLKRKGYRLEEVLMVDDTPTKLERNYGNLIRVSEWLGDPADSELLALMGYLVELKRVPNVRTLEKRGWQRRFRST